MQPPIAAGTEQSYDESLGVSDVKSVIAVIHFNGELIGKVQGKWADMPTTSNLAYVVESRVQ